MDAVTVANLIGKVMLCRSVSVQRCRGERMVINKEVLGKRHTMVHRFLLQSQWYPLPSRVDLPSDSRKMKSVLAFLNFFFYINNLGISVLPRSAACVSKAVTCRRHSICLCLPQCKNYHAIML